MKKFFAKLSKAMGRGLLALLKFLWAQLVVLFKKGRTRFLQLNRTTQQAIVVAVVLHLILLIVAGFMIAIPGKKVPPEIVATVVETQVAPNLQQRRLSAMKQIRQTQPSASSAISRMLLANTDAAVSLPKTKIDIRAISPSPGVGHLGLGRGFGSGLGAGGGGGGTFPMEIRGRCIPGERMRLLKTNGGDEMVEAAVMKSLDWLQETQNPDGTWGRSHKSAMTGLAILCYLGHCETPTSKKYGKTVTKGIQAIMTIGKENKNGYFTRLKSAEFVYEHGIATYALGEALAMSGDNELPGLRKAFSGGVQKIVNSQLPEGGWCYYYADKGAEDLSVTGWQVQALKAAQQNNVAVSGLQSCMERAASFVATRQGPKGGFGYKKIGDKHSLTGVGILSLQFLGRPSRERASRAFAFWFEKLPQFSYEDDCNLYATYYVNQAIFNYGGETWQLWNAQMKPELLRMQASNGSFPVEEGALSRAQAGSDAAFYRTTLCTLMLEVYYRYLPVNRF